MKGLVRYYQEGTPSATPDGLYVGGPGYQGRGDSGEHIWDSSGDADLDVFVLPWLPSVDLPRISRPDTPDSVKAIEDTIRDAGSATEDAIRAGGDYVEDNITDPVTDFVEEEIVPPIEHGCRSCGGSSQRYCRLPRRDYYRPSRRVRY